MTFGRIVAEYTASDVFVIFTIQTFYYHALIMHYCAYIDKMGVLQ